MGELLCLKQLDNKRRNKSVYIGSMNLEKAYKRLTGKRYGVFIRINVRGKL